MHTELAWETSHSRASPNQAWCSNILNINHLGMRNNWYCSQHYHMSVLVAIPMLNRVSAIASAVPSIHAISKFTNTNRHWPDDVRWDSPLAISH